MKIESSQAPGEGVRCYVKEAGQLPRTRETPTTTDNSYVTSPPSFKMCPNDSLSKLIQDYLYATYSSKFASIQIGHLVKYCTRLSPSHKHPNRAGREEETESFSTEFELILNRLLTITTPCPRWVLEIAVATVFSYSLLPRSQVMSRNRLRHLFLPSYLRIPLPPPFFRFSFLSLIFNSV